MISVILLAGGMGTRMGATIPKQYLSLLGKPIAQHSFLLFSKHPRIEHITVVCEEKWQEHFPGASAFALPGPRRQDSVYNGLQLTPGDLITIHDAARPLISVKDLNHVLDAGQRYGAAVLGSPAVATYKLVDSDGFVEKTLDRQRLWQIFTPQVLKREILEAGFMAANGRDVTDDVALAELAGYPVRIVAGSPDNIKITCPQDLKIAESLCGNTN